MEIPEIKLTYFDTRGRGQFIRYYLRYREIPYTDDRIALSDEFSEWLSIKDDQNITGPFKKLPVLNWGDNMIAETMVIHSFLHNELGDASNFSSEENYRQAMLASSLYGDFMVQIGTLIWSDILFEGLDLNIAVNKTHQKIQDHLQLLEKTIQDWQWLENLDSRSFTITDCLLWEELDVIKHVFHDYISFEKTESLGNFYNECPGRSIFKQLLNEHPNRITGRPQEVDAIAKIQKILAS